MVICLLCASACMFVYGHLTYTTRVYKFVISQEHSHRYVGLLLNNHDYIDIVIITPFTMLLYARAAPPSSYPASYQCRRHRSFCGLQSPASRKAHTQTHNFACNNIIMIVCTDTCTDCDLIYFQ